MLRWLKYSTPQGNRQGQAKPYSLKTKQFKLPVRR
jgi:hypothetical protein